MDFRRLSKAWPTASPQNETQPMNLTELSPSILDTLIPGYSLISQYAQDVFGVDISVFVTVGILAVALTKGGKYLFEQMEVAFRYLFISSVYIDDEDDLFDMVMAWLDARASARIQRSVRAKTQRGSQWDDANESAAGEALDDNGLFDYNKWAARTPPRYEPYYGRNLIWHDGQLLIFKRTRKPAQQTLQITWGSPQEDLLQLDCVGRSTQPIKDLLRGIKAWSLDKKRHTTTIRHPTPKDRARFGGAWSKTSSRPSRPMSTVILDQAQKNMIIQDMNEYLHPNSPKWYATRGIPYRRGYLFHGPPGTGKTSLSFALAGIFGLEIYAISLQEPTMTEGDLMQLFNSLPKRCIVLLEDVDAAGLLRDGNSDKKSKKKDKSKKEDGADKEKEKKDSKKDAKKEDDYTLKDLAKELKSISNTSSRGKGNESSNNTAQGHPNKTPGAGISLSGLLNAIDGVATHEGRCLIMTTNHPEKLDAALVRPGRVDRKVEFRLAMKQQVRELFVRMYSVADGEEDEQPAPPKLKPSALIKAAAATNGHAKVPHPGEKQASYTSEQLDTMAEEFTGHIPDDTFTPAEIQNHLMRWKKEPSTAISTVDKWKTEVLEEKEKQRKKVEEEAEDDDDD